jgi:succinyl-diaminopimelate desuccinylase
MKELLCKLIKAKSTVDVGEVGAAGVLADFFRQTGIDYKIDTWDTNRANISVCIKSKSRQKKALIFVSHLDVVPQGEQSWENAPFAAVEKDGKIYGRGSADMKAGIAAMASAVAEVAGSRVELKGDLILAATAGEETDSVGAKRFLTDELSGQPLAGIIITEPTDFNVVSAHRGILWLEIITKGKTAHGSQPHLGVNAISSMTELLNVLGDYEIPCAADPLLGGSSMSVNVIKAGAATNVIPDRCSIQVDIRTVPSQPHREIIDGFYEIFNNLEQHNRDFDAEIKILRDVKPLSTDADCDFVKQLCRVVGRDGIKPAPFTTDGPFLAHLAPVVIFGPGKPELCHKPDEYIDITDLERAKELYKKIIIEFLT